MSALKLIFSRGRKSPAAARTAGRCFAGAWLLCALFVWLTFSVRAQTNISEFPITRQAPVGPTAMAYGPDGAYWFTEDSLNNGYIGRIDTVSNIITEILLTNRLNSQPFGIVATTNLATNYLWFTEASNNVVGRLSVNSNYLEFPLTITNSRPFTLVVGPDNNLWFSEFARNRIATFSPTNASNPDGTLKLLEYGPFGISTRFGAPGTNAEIYGLTAGPDHNIWFAQASYGAIGKLTLNGSTVIQTNIYYLPDSNSVPVFIAAGSDGAMWFTEFNSNKIGRITIDVVSTNVAQYVTQYNIPSPFGFPFPDPYYIMPGPDGNLWFTDFGGSAVGRITTNGIITLFPTITNPGVPTLMATGGDGNIWFGEFPSSVSSVTDNIGLLRVAQSLSLSAGNLVTSSTTFNGLVAVIQNSAAQNTVLVTWGDGTTSSVTLSDTNLNASAFVSNQATVNGVTVNNTLTITNVAGINPVNGANGTYNVLATHTFPGITSFPLSIEVVDGRNDFAFATNLVVTTGGASPLTSHFSHTNLTLSWPAYNYVLQSSATANGGFTNVPGATSPYTSQFTGASRFFRLRSQ